MFNRLYLSPGKVGANAACNYWSNLGSVHQVPITAGSWTEAVKNTKFTQHFYTDQHWESNPRPSDLESNALSTRPHAPTFFFLKNHVRPTLPKKMAGVFFPTIHWISGNYCKVSKEVWDWRVKFRVPVIYRVIWGRVQILTMQSYNQLRCAVERAKISSMFRARKWRTSLSQSESGRCSMRNAASARPVADIMQTNITAGFGESFMFPVRKV